MNELVVQDHVPRPKQHTLAVPLSVLYRRGRRVGVLRPRVVPGEAFCMRARGVDLVKTF